MKRILCATLLLSMSACKPTAIDESIEDVIRKDSLPPGQCQTFNVKLLGIRTAYTLELCRSVSNGQ